MLFRSGKKTKCVSHEQAKKLNPKTGETLEEGLPPMGGAICTPPGGEEDSGITVSGKDGKMRCEPNKPPKKKDPKKKELEEAVPTVSRDELDDDDVVDGPGNMSVKDGKLVKVKEGSKIQTPEQENTLYEQRFSAKNNRLFEKLVKEWTK